jgi:hypothetical protein
MPLGFAALLAINVGLFGLSRLFRRRPAVNAKALETPTAEEGRPLPVVYGLQTLTPNTGWWGRTTTTTDNDGITYSYAKMALPLCLGPITAIHDFQFGGKSCALHPVTKYSSGPPDVQIGGFHLGVITEPVTPTLPVTLPQDGTAQEFYVAAQDMFGGAFQQGGVAGVIRVYAGTETQAIDPLFTEEQTADRASGHPYQAIVILGAAESGAPYGYDGSHANTDDGLFYFGANITAPQPLTVVVQRIPTGLLDLGLDADYTTAAIGSDANAGEIIFDLWTNPVCGRGRSSSELDTDALTAFALTCLHEGRGLSLTLEQRTDPLDVIDAILTHVHGIRYTDIDTGKLVFKLLRNDYTLADCPELSAATADDIEIAFPGAIETVNEVKVSYHKYDPGTRGPITGETLTSNLVYTGFFAILQTTGRNISDVTLYDDGVEIDPANYDAGNQTRGVILLMSDSGVAEGSTITIDYTADPTFIGFRDAESAPVPNLANQFMTGDVKSETYDRPYFTTDANAAWAAAMQMQLVGRPLATVTALMHRTDPLVKPGSVVRVTRPEIGMVDVAFRVDPAGYGTLETGGCGSVRWRTCGRRTPRCRCRRARARGRAGTRRRRRRWRSATSPARPFGWRSFRVIRRLRWSCTGDVVGAARATTVLSSTIAGTTALLRRRADGGGYPVLPGAARARGWTAGAWTPWQAMTAAAGTPTTTPTGTDPTFALSWDDALGTFTVTVTDPDGRLQTVEFRHRSGTGAFTAWTADASAPYTDTVTLDPTYDSRIEARVTYLNTAGDTVTQEFAHDFLVTPVRFAMASLTTATRVTVALKVKVTDTVTVSAPRTYSVVRTLYTSGEVVEVPLDIAGTLAAYTVVGDVSGSATVGLTRATSGGFPSFSDLTGGGNLTLSSAQRHTDTTLSGFTTALAAGDTLKLTLSSVTTCTRVTVCLRIDAAGGASGGATALDDLSDVTITSPANGQALVRRAGVFVNDAIAQADVTSLVTDLAAKAPLASPTFTGTVTIPTPSAADNSTKAASTAYVQGELASYAPKASPTFTGTPAAPTAGAGTNTTQLATTAFVTAAVAAVAAGTPTYVGVRVTNSANQTIATGTATAVTFDTEQYDPNGMHSTVSNTSRLTCQVAGKYHIYGGTFWDANTTGIREWFIRLNGSTILSYLSTNPVGSGGGTSQIISTTYALAVSDYVELLAKQTSGGNLNILARSTEGMHQFGADLLGS